MIAVMLSTPARADYVNFEAGQLRPPTLSGDAAVTVDEIVLAVNDALAGCRPQP